MKKVRPLPLLILLALILRLGYMFTRDQAAPFTAGGGDTVWYLNSGYTLMTGDDLGGTVYIRRLPTAPLYLIIIGTAQAVFGRTEMAIIAIRLVQVILSTATVYLAARLAQRITGRARAGWWAASVLAISPALILESATILTETVYIFLVMAGLVVYGEAVVATTALQIGEKNRAQQAAHLQEMRGWFSSVKRLSPTARGLIIAGVLFGLATLTRAVLLLFPFGLLIHLIWVRGGRTGLKQAALLLAVYWIVVLTWTVYNLARWDRFVVGAEGMTSFLYVGSRGWDDPQVVDQQLAEDLGAEGEDLESVKNSSGYLEAAGNVIGRDPLGYARRRIGELARACLQPQGTVHLSGESLKEIARQWLDEDRSLRGLWGLTRGDHFWPKLALYGFHFGGLIMGAAGAFMLRRDWRLTLPLIGFIGYTLLLHLIMLALPRYIFPTYPVFWVLGAAVLDRGGRAERNF
jgi:4-amino-4-deoxy-L-arabinose transferase-like glycosyltransferase